MSYFNNYYFSSFFWNTFQKVLAAIVGFVSVPLLLGFYGKEQYGILSLATACNSYMHLLDLGMNVGAVRYFSLWRSQGKNDRINRVARTNITFYGFIAIINALLLMGVAWLGESLFAVSHVQFMQLQTCLAIIASFSLLSWGATTFNQLLVADKQIAYTAQVQSALTLLKLLLIWCALKFQISLSLYFVIFTAIVSFAVVPYIYRCLKSKLIDSIKPALYWKDFNIVLTFSLSIFALSLFQMTAIQTRPIILGVFASDGATVNAEYRIIEVIPQFITMIAGTLSSIFLPKTAELIASCDFHAISSFAYRWTIIATVITNMLCFPFILGTEEVISAYVGHEYSYLSTWMISWIVCTMINMHNSPSYSLVMALGKTKVLVYVCGFSAVFSILANALLAKILGVGSAVVAYYIYVIFVLSVYYVYYYKKYFCIRGQKLLSTFLLPTLCGVLAMLIVMGINNLVNFNILDQSTRMYCLFEFVWKAVLWFFVYVGLIRILGIVKLQDGKIITFYEKRKI